MPKANFTFTALELMAFIKCIDHATVWNNGGLKEYEKELLKVKKGEFLKQLEDLHAKLDTE